MEEQQLYKELTEIAAALYQNQNTGMVRLAEAAEQIQNFFEKAIQVSHLLSAELNEILLNFNEAVQYNDKLLTADIIYYDMCNVLAEYMRFQCENIQNVAIRERKVKTESLIDPQKNFQRNMEKMAHADIDIYHVMKTYCNDFSVDTIEDTAVDYYDNIAVLKEGRWWGLNSFYHSESAVEIGIEPIRRSRYIGTIYIFGMSNLEYIKKIFEIVSQDTIVVIFEPDSHVFMMNMYYHDMTELFERKNTFVYAEGVNEKQLDALVQCMSDNLSSNYLYTFISPGYDVLYKEILEKRITSINAALRNACSIDVTISSRSESINYNRIMNLSLLFESILLSDLKNQFQEKINLKKTPVIIVAAGPSLDKNIEDLKEAKGKAFIFATDSAIRMLQKHDITPDAYITIDPIKPQVLFENELADETPLFYCSNSVFEHIRGLRGRKVFCHIDNMIPPIIEESETQISAGGNVASSAFSVAQYLGFQNIIMIGQDLAFTDDKKHASVVYDEKQLSEEDSSQYPYVKGQNGEMLRTFQNFLLYKEWYEGTLEKYKDQIKCINATEGGAYIEGAEHMTLKQAVALYCQDSVDIREIILQCPDSFDEEQKNSKREYIEKLGAECDEAKENWLKCCQCYETILASQNPQEMKQMMKIIDEYDQKTNKMYAVDIIIDYSRAEVDQRLNEMYAESRNGTASSLEDVKKIADKGITVLQVFIKNAEKTKAVFEQCLERI